jgi:hypothetical protein
MNNRTRSQIPDDNSIFSLETDFDAEEDSLLPRSSPASPIINHRTNLKDQKPLSNQTHTATISSISSTRRPVSSSSANHPLLSDSFKASPSIFGSKKLDDDPFTIEMNSNTGTNNVNFEDKVQYAHRSGQGKPKQSFVDRLLCRPLPPSSRTFNIGIFFFKSSIFIHFLL